MKTEEIMPCIIALIDACGISPEDLFDRITKNELTKEAERVEQSRPDPVVILRDGIKAAKKITQMEDDDIGKLIGVTGGAVGHWRRGRTRPEYQNRVAIMRWLRNVEDALGVEILPVNFSQSDLGDEANGEPTPLHVRQ